MQRFVVGDIHGCLTELKALIRGLPIKPGDALVFLGDYIDRGTDSRGVVDFILELEDRRKFEIHCLKGNHEDMLLSFLDLGGDHGDMFLLNGGLATLKSYGVHVQRTTHTEAAELMSALPARHIDFFKSLETSCFLDEFLCVHAGVQALRTWEEQIDEELIWIRDEFIMNPHPFPYTVLFGHTPMEEVFFHLPYKVGLDTGLVYGNLLTCLETTSKTLYQVKKGTEQVRVTAVAHCWKEVTS